MIVRLRAAIRIPGVECWAFSPSGQGPNGVDRDEYGEGEK
jgi:hypothetical protein